MTRSVTVPWVTVFPLSIACSCADRVGFTLVSMKFSNGSARPNRGALLHEPAVTDDEGLAGHGSRREGRAEQRRLGHVFDGGEQAVHRVLEHDVLDDLVFRDAQGLGLLGNLLV